MYSSEDLERFYFQYQTEALPHGESLQSFCVKNKVPYNIFQKWYRDTRKKVVEVQVDGAPVIGHEEQSSAIDQPQPVSPGRTDHPVRIWVEIRISNGLHLFHFLLLFLYKKTPNLSLTSRSLLFVYKSD